MMVADGVVVKIFSQEYVVMKIELRTDVVVKNWSQTDVVMNNFPINLLEISWLHKLDMGNLKSGKFLHCYVNYPGCWGILIP